jgi:hypothetical protein
MKPHEKRYVIMSSVLYQYYVYFKDSKKPVVIRTKNYGKAHTRIFSLYSVSLIMHFRFHCCPGAIYMGFTLPLLC